MKAVASLLGGLVPLCSANEIATFIAGQFTGSQIPDSFGSCWSASEDAWNYWQGQLVELIDADMEQYLLDTGRSVAEYTAGRIQIWKAEWGPNFRQSKSMNKGFSSEINYCMWPKMVPARFTSGEKTWDVKKDHIRVQFTCNQQLLVCPAAAGDHCEYSWEKGGESELERCEQVGYGMHIASSATLSYTPPDSIGGVSGSATSSTGATNSKKKGTCRALSSSSSTTRTLSVPAGQTLCLQIFVECADVAEGKEIYKLEDCATFTTAVIKTVIGAGSSCPEQICPHKEVKNLPGWLNSGKVNNSSDNTLGLQKTSGIVSLVSLGAALLFI